MSKAPNWVFEETNEFMANQALISPPERPEEVTQRGVVQPEEELHLLPRTTANESLWTSLQDNVRAVFFPEKLPPLRLTSRPVAGAQHLGRI